MGDTVLLAKDGPIATITINRPEVMNAIDYDTMRGLLTACEAVEADGQVRAVVLTGAGPAFVAGGDVAQFRRMLDKPEFPIEDGIEVLQSITRSLRRMPKPVLASVRGSAAGAGFSLMCACDLVIAADDAVFTLAYAQIGVTPDGGATHTLPRIVGMKRAAELLMLPDLFGADRAERLGLVNWLVPGEALDKETARVAARLANGPTVVFARAKALLEQSGTVELDRQLAAEKASFAYCATETADFHEGVTAFAEKRTPRFKGR